MEEEKVSKTKKNSPKKKQGGKGFQLGLSIKVQLIVGFIIPILFVVWVGVSAYNKAQDAMVANYEASAIATIEAKMEYLEYALTVVDRDAMDIKLNSDLKNLVSGHYDADPVKAASAIAEINTNIKTMQVSNELLSAISIIPQSDIGVLSTKNGGANMGGQNTKSQLNAYVGSEEGKAVFEEKNSDNWLGQHIDWYGSHTDLDQKIGIDSDSYAMSYMSFLQNKKALVVLDISKESILEMLQAIDVTDGAIAGFITADNKEVVVTEEGKDFSFVEQDFFPESLAGEALSDAEYVTIDGKQYLYIYSKDNQSGIVISYLVPYAKVVAGAYSIRNMTVRMVVIATLIALCIGTLIILSISTSIDEIIKKLRQVASGDLTVSFSQKGSKEFKILSKNVAEMTEHMRRLLSDVDATARLVADSAAQIGQVSGQVDESSTDIIHALEEIDAGVSQQASDLQDCLQQMDGLSQNIDMMGGDVERAENGTNVSRKIVTGSISTLDVLADQTNKTIEITQKVKEDVARLERKSSVIHEFVGMINDIAEETNLLSLNASIEAARAGDAGRGFAVVAEEIRKLADGSQAAANEIARVVDEIITQTRETVENAQEASKIVDSQAKVVNDTKDAFKNINYCTEEMAENVEEIAGSIGNIEEERTSTLNSISSISAVSEQTAASSSHVYGVAQGQHEVVQSLKVASDELIAKMEELGNALAEFKI
ncbi:MAG: methyl-accepting chemotaxis protein [Lachnospiraceae bacterium]|nr:methyl-accepting chemotaxis protein [Lachnospiraceae bacterium]